MSRVCPLLSIDVTLGGELSVANSGYSPMMGDSFVVAAFDERLTDSTFSSISIEGFNPGVSFDVIEHNVTLAVTAVPELESWALFLAGLGLVGAVGSRRRPIAGTASVS